MVASRQSVHPEFRHRSSSYRGDDAFVDQARRFVLDGVGRGHPTLVAVPPHLELPLVNALDHPESIRFVDMVDLGRNPSRIIPAVIEFLQEMEGATCRFLAQPWWTGRTDEENDEVSRSDALIDVGLGSLPVSILRLFDADGPLPIEPAGQDPEEIFSEEVWPLEDPPEDDFARDLRFGTDLAALRGHVHRQVSRVGMETQRCDDLVLAVNEVASNSVRFGGGGGTLAMWRQGTAIVCEVVDGGTITDPLVGRLPPGPDLDAKGLWLVNQLCDLVQIRSGSSGTRVRLRVDC